MADELITYGMIRDKNYTVPVTKQDNEYAIKEDFEFGGAVGLIPMTNLSGYESMELIPDSAIPIRKTFTIISNKAGTVYLTNYSIPRKTNLDSLISKTVRLGDNTIRLPVTVSGSSGNVSLDVGSNIYIYEKLKLGNKLLANYNIVNGGSVTVTFSDGGGTTPPDPTDSMIINFSGVSSGYTYAFVIGTGLLTGDIPILFLSDGAITYKIPITVYNSNTGKSQGVSSGTVSIYRKSGRIIGSNWEFRTSFSVVAGSNISVNV